MAIESLREQNAATPATAIGRRSLMTTSEVDVADLRGRLRVARKLRLPAAGYLSRRYQSALGRL